MVPNVCWADANTHRFRRWKFEPLNKYPLFNLSTVAFVINRCGFIHIVDKAPHKHVIQNYVNQTVIRKNKIKKSFMWITYKHFGYVYCNSLRFSHCN